MNNTLPVGYTQAIENLVFYFKDPLIALTDLTILRQHEDLTDVILEVFEEDEELRDAWMDYLDIEKTISQEYRVDKTKIRVDTFSLIGYSEVVGLI